MAINRPIVTIYSNCKIHALAELEQGISVEADVKSFGALFREIREELDVSQSKVARRGGITRPRGVGEAEERVPGIDRAREMALGLGFHLSDVVAHWEELIDRQDLMSRRLTPHDDDTKATWDAADRAVDPEPDDANSDPPNTQIGGAPMTDRDLNEQLVLAAYYRVKLTRGPEVQADFAALVYDLGFEWAKEPKTGEELA